MGEGSKVVVKASLKRQQYRVMAGPSQTIGLPNLWEDVSAISLWVIPQAILVSTNSEGSRYRVSSS